jgi:pyruvate/2-oxoglutarate dehydrogenase complex dihydrolipoamide acyltransferase (E2) component
MKQLVTATTIEQFLTSHKDVFPVTNDTLITPSAADLAKTKGIKFVAEGEITTGSAMEIKQTSEHADSIAAGAHHADAPQAAAPAPAEEAAAPAAEPSVANFTKEQIVEAVIKVLDAKGILDKILD